jgi:RNA polymerase sigma-70 factor (ECF subfamily)
MASSSTGESLAVRFRRHVRDEVTDLLPADDQLERVLDRHVEAGRAAWPEIDPDPEPFLELVAGKLVHEERLVDLAALAGADLFLVAACAAGDARAIEVFHRHHAGDIVAALRKLGASAAVIDEVAQRVMRELLVAEPGRSPRIAGYAGRGSLKGWLRTITMRTFMKTARAAAADPATEDAALAGDVAAAGDPELEYMKRLYGAEVDRAFAAALAALTPRERNLLRQHHLDGLTIDELGAFYRVHRATAARWVAAAREALLDGIRARLADELQLTASEVESVIRLVQSRIHVSLSMLAASP